MFRKFSVLYRVDGDIPFCRNVGMVHMYHHTRHHIPEDRNHVTSAITESNLMYGNSHDNVIAVNVHSDSSIKHYVSISNFVCVVSCVG
jgi:hypothetical protein